MSNLTEYLPHPTTLPCPLERLEGLWQQAEQGRTVTEGLLDASNDLQAIQAWLGEVRHAPQTFRAYRKEAERLLLWSLLERERPLAGLRREDLQAYEDFLAHPQPLERWCGPVCPRFSPQWRPFRGPLGDSSRHTALVILRGLFNYLVETGYLQRNPLALRRRRRRVAVEPSTERYLEPREWQALLHTVECLPQDSWRQQLHYRRCRLLLHVVFLLGSRVGEVANARMGDFIQRRGYWWWQVVGKGQKAARVPVNQDMLAELTAFRSFLGWSPLPLVGEQRPLITALDGQRGMTANMLYRIVRRLMQETATRLEANHPEGAARLRQASIHWLRHTSISAQLQAGLDIATVQRNARHSRLDTTGHYLHQEEARWHAAMEAHHLITPEDE